MTDATERHWLSRAGQQRKTQILQLALATAAQKRRRRHALRMGVGYAAVALVALGALMLCRQVIRTRPGYLVPEEVVSQQPRHPLAPAGIERNSPAVVIEQIQTDPTLVDRLSIGSEPRRWQSIDDDELIRDLAAVGKHAGIVRTDTRAFLLISER